MAVNMAGKGAPVQTEEIEVVEVSEISPQNQALYDVGRELILQSLSVGRDYCRFMITTSLSSIPIYFSILTFNLQGQQALDTSNKIFLMSPVLLFLIAALVFTLGFLPAVSNFSLDVIEQIETARSLTIRKRNTLIRIGVAFFISAVLFASIVIAVLM
jgi:hypothetical protein